VFIRIDPQSPEPIFEQIIFQVKGSTARGELKPGDKLPSVRELAKELAVNPNTVIRAFEALERDHVVVRRQGAGCFVTDRKSFLSSDERRRQLDNLVKRLVTEAYHLGCNPEDIRQAVDGSLTGLHFPEEGREA
jgi:GntR family transcriptional regulator